MLITQPRRTDWTVHWTEAHLDLKRGSIGEKENVAGYLKLEPLENNSVYGFVF